MIDLKKTFTCGQCFRWKEEFDGSFTGAINIDGGRIVNIKDGDVGPSMDRSL